MFGHTSFENLPNLRGFASVQLEGSMTRGYSGKLIATNEQTGYGRIAGFKQQHHLGVRDRVPDILDEDGSFANREVDSAAVW